MALTETAHAAEFILSEASGQRSREEATVEVGQDLAAGTVIALNGLGRIIAWAAGTSVDAVGVVIYPADATSALVKHVAYIARDAEVNVNLIAYPDGQLAAVEADLALLGIITR